MPVACTYALEIINKITNTYDRRKSHMANFSVLATGPRASRVVYVGADSLLETLYTRARDTRKWLSGNGSGFAYRAGFTKVGTGSRL